MFYSLATLLDEKTWHEILDQMPEGRDIILSRKPDLELVHLSWIVSKGVLLESLSDEMRYVATSTDEFDAFNGGIGVFPGMEPVLTLLLARSKQMCELQSILWNKCRPYMTGIINHYSPDLWIPHITLFYQQKKPDELCDLMGKIVSNEITFNLRINNLSLIYLDNDNAGLLNQFNLQSPDGNR